MFYYMVWQQKAATTTVIAFSVPTASMWHGARATWYTQKQWNLFMCCLILSIYERQRVRIHAKSSHRTMNIKRVACVHCAHIVIGNEAKVQKKFLTAENGWNRTKNACNATFVHITTSAKFVAEYLNILGMYEHV